VSELPIDLTVDELIVHGTVRYSHADLLEAVERELRRGMIESPSPPRRLDPASSPMTDPGMLAEAIQPTLPDLANRGRGSTGQSDEELGRRHVPGRRYQPHGAD